VTTLEDDRDIRNVLHRYCRGIDRIDLDLVLACYWPGAHDDHGGFKGTIEEFVTWVAPLLPTNAVTTHVLSNILVEGHPTDPAVARVESYGMAEHQTPGGEQHQNMTVAFRDIDTFERRDGEWRIAERFRTTEWVRFHDQASIGPIGRRFTRGDRGDRTDPIYRPWP
jgi:hypothetical protein